MSSCKLGPKEISINSDKIFYAIPLLALGFGINQFLGFNLPPVEDFISASLLIFSAIFVVVFVIFLTRGKWFQWLIFSLLLANIIGSTVLIIIEFNNDGSESQLKMNGTDLTLNATINSNGSDTGMSIESQNVTGNVNATNTILNSSPNESKPRRKSLIPNFLFGILLFMNALCAFRISITKEDIPNVPADPIELKPLDKDNQNQNEIAKDGDHDDSLNPQ